MAITKEEIIYRRLEMYRDTLLLNCYPDSFAVDHFFFQKTSQDGFYDSCYIDTEQKVRNIYFPKIYYIYLYKKLKLREGIF